MRARVCLAGKQQTGKEEEQKAEIWGLRSRADLCVPVGLKMEMGTESPEVKLGKGK